MKKLLLLTVVFFCGYAIAQEEKNDDSVAIKMVSSITADKAVAPEVLKEVQEDAQALTKKYEEVCGVKVVVEQSEQITPEQTRELEVCADCGQAHTAEIGCCGRPTKPKPKSVESEEYCTCEVVRSTCPDCGKIIEDVQCNCGGKDRPRNMEIDLCSCGGNKPKPTKAANTDICCDVEKLQITGPSGQEETIWVPITEASN